MTVFSDFRCPFCAALARDLRVLDTMVVPVSRVRFRHNPSKGLPGHSLLAAVAAECGSKQVEFRIVHDALFAGADLVEIEKLVEKEGDTAHSSGNEFRSCLEAKAANERIAKDAKYLEELSLSGTPHIVVGRRWLVGYVGLDTLLSVIRSEGSSYR